MFLFWYVCFHFYAFKLNIFSFWHVIVPHLEVLQFLLDIAIADAHMKHATLFLSFQCQLTSLQWPVEQVG
jgi:hypothetical protein